MCNHQSLGEIGRIFGLVSGSVCSSFYRKRFFFVIVQSKPEARGNSLFRTAFTTRINGHLLFSSRKHISLDDRVQARQEQYIDSKHQYTIQQNITLYKTKRDTTITSA